MEVCIACIFIQIVGYYYFSSTALLAQLCVQNMCAHNEEILQWWWYDAVCRQSFTRRSRNDITRNGRKREEEEYSRDPYLASWEEELHAAQATTRHVGFVLRVALLHEARLHGSRIGRDVGDRFSGFCETCRRNSHERSSGLRLAMFVIFRIASKNTHIYECTYRLNRCKNRKNNRTLEITSSNSLHYDEDMRKAHQLILS